MTVLSRCLQFNLQRLAPTLIREQLARIVAGCPRHDQRRRDRHGRLVVGHGFPSSHVRCGALASSGRSAAAPGAAAKKYALAPGKRQVAAAVGSTPPGPP
jgi:hypothetical protein